MHRNVFVSTKCGWTDVRRACGVIREYDGAGHGFFRAAENENATEANRLAREQGIQRLKENLKGL